MLQTWNARNFDYDKETHKLALEKPIIECDAIEALERHALSFIKRSKTCMFLCGAWDPMAQTDVIRLVFSVHNDSFFDLIVGESSLLQNITSFVHFDEFVAICWEDMNRVFASGDLHIRFSGKIFLQPTFLREWIVSARRFGFNNMVIDGNPNLSEETLPQISIVFFKNSNRQHVNSVVEMHDTATDYFINKAKLEHWLLKHNIMEGQDQLDLQPTLKRKLRDLYLVWLTSLVANFVSHRDMPRSLVTFSHKLFERTSNEVLVREFETSKDNWAAFFSSPLFESKFPVLLAHIYLWRIAHLLKIRIL